MTSAIIDQILDASEVARKNHNYQKADEILSSGLRQNPDSFELMVRYGWFLRNRGRFSEAIHILRHAQRVEPNHYDVLYNLAIALESDLQMEVALQAHSLLLEKFPEDPDARMAFAEANTTYGRPDKALPIIQRLMEVSPEDLCYRVS